jgi:cbb3-type cytochrome oxidase cytochrome c subunit
MSRRTTTIAWTALALLVLVLAVAAQDRAWKGLQAEYRELELARLRAELDVELGRSEDAAAALEGELERARDRFEARRDDVRQLERQLARARRAASWAADELARQEAVRGGGAAVREARRRLEERRREELELSEQLAGLEGELEEVEARRRAVLERPESLARRIAELERGRWLRRVPGLRGLDPTLAVLADTPPGLTRPTFAGAAARVDRCRTCHLRSHESDPGMEAGEAAPWPSPFGGHPGRLVGDGTPHPASRFGCTACHGGEGRATDFSRAGHWPTSAEQEAAWAGEWGYAREAVSAAAILPPALVEAGCAHCHVEAPRSIEGRASLDRGRRLVARMGCDGCHTSEGTGGDRPGPPLDRLAVKTTPGWAFQWIAAPRRFRPTTWMPHVLAETGSEERRTAEIRAMVLYLWSRSAAAAAYAEAPAGDAGAGARLFWAVGCAGCHLIDAAASRDEEPSPPAPLPGGEGSRTTFERLHGPNLARTGNKVDAGWLYAWLRDARSYRPDTPMPDLRLTTGEAADLTAFLMASRDAEWEGLELPTADAAVRDELVRQLLEDELTLAASAERLAAMDADAKELYLGRRSLEAYGCHGCHEVPGLAEAPPVAAPLAAFGRDPRRWLPRPESGSAAALAHRPRPGARAAPDYGWSRAEADAVLVALLARTPATAEPWRRAEHGERARALAAGRRLLERYGCLGCHRLGGDGGAVAATLAGREQRPPDLTSAGGRFQPSWLFAYLRAPAAFARRPWLTARMPTFQLARGETDALVRFFAAREDQPLFAAPLPEPAQRDVEVGRAVAAMLQCHACHLEARDALQRDQGELAPPELAPSYRGVRDRLRSRWVVEWILDPRRFVPDTEMPVIFLRDAGGRPDASYLKPTISAPMFADQRARLMPHFASEQELLDYLEDAPRVARALRDYLWSLD